MKNYSHDPKSYPRICFSEQALQERVRDLGAQISQDYEGKEILLVGILKGSFLFMADLIRHIELPLEVDFMAVSSYEGMKSTGVVQIVKDLATPIAGRHVIIVEDIVDTGLTLKYLWEHFEIQHPASMAVCSLLMKAESSVKCPPVNYVGFPCPNEFVIGYGLDYEGKYRNLPFIAAIDSPDDL